MVKVGRERADLALQLKENEEEMQELIKKYKVGLCLRRILTAFVKAVCHDLKPLSGKCRCRKHGPDYNPGPGGNYSGNILIDLDSPNNILSGCHQHNTVH